MVIELTPHQFQRREELTLKLRDGYISEEEANELMQILEYEKQQAISLNDVLAVFAIASLLYLLINFLSENKKKKKRKFRLSGFFSHFL
jgi:hypothetical protein